VFFVHTIHNQAEIVTEVALGHYTALEVEVVAVAVDILRIVCTGAEATNGMSDMTVVAVIAVHILPEVCIGDVLVPVHLPIVLG
jgi:hypothetical protein